MTIKEEKQVTMFGCTVAEIERSLANKNDRERLMYAMGVLSDAQEAQERGGRVHEMLNLAKYVIDDVRSRLPR